MRVRIRDMTPTQHAETVVIVSRKLHELEPILEDLPQPPREWHDQARVYDRSTTHAIAGCSMRLYGRSLGNRRRSASTPSRRFVRTRYNCDALLDTRALVKVNPCFMCFF